MSEKNNKAKKPLGLIIALILMLAAEVVFLLSMMTLDVLPGKYVALLIAVLVIIDAVVVLLLNKGRGKKSLTIVGVILCILMIIGMAGGTYYAYNTYVTLAKISEYKAHWEDFDVIVAKNGTYKNENDIKGKTVYAFDNPSKMYTEAKEKLITKSDVKFEYLEDLDKVGQMVVANDGNVINNVIFISDNSYQMLCDEDKTWEKETEKLFSIKVAKRENDNREEIDVTKDPFNICISGIDMWGSIDQVSRSDVNMIVTVNPQTHEILLSSVPRDSYVVLHSFQELDKLTHSGVYGIDETVTTLEDWLDIDINRYVRVDFSMLVDIVNAIGGVDVYSDYEFKSSISHWKYKKGWNYLTGKKALYFARERHAFEDEDQQRIKNQQKVMEACIKKMTSSKTLLTKYTDILKAVDGEMETDISEKEMAALVRMQLNDMPKWTIKKQSVQGDLTMKGTYSMGFGRDLLVSIPREESVKKVSENIHNTLYPIDK